MTAAAALAAALDLGAHGYAAFPCRPNKRPACPHGFHDATSDAAELRALWQRYPGVLVGVATGPASQIAALDIDAKHPEVRQWWEVHRSRLPPTRAHRTRSGGLHLIFGHYDSLKCSAGKIARGIDVRAEGGYLIWWPAAGLPVLSDPPIAPWPDDLIEALAAPAHTAPKPTLPALKRLPPRMRGDLRPTLHRALGITRTVADAPEGERNRVLYWAACRVRDMIRAGELDRPAGVQVINTLFAAAVRAGLPAREAERTMRSAMRAA
jgi:hypothetical protein